MQRYRVESILSVVYFLFSYQCCFGVDLVYFNYDRIVDISSNGNVVAGFTNNGGKAFRWTASTGLVDVAPSNVDTNSGHLGMSADGNTIVGRWGYQNAFIWNSSTGFNQLDPGFVPSTNLSMDAWDISDDGRIVAGSFTNDPFKGAMPMIYTVGTGMQILGNIGGSGNGYSSKISGDGNVTFVQENNSGSYIGPVKWTNGTNAVKIQPPGFNFGVVRSTSFDGSVYGGEGFAGGSSNSGWYWSNNSGYVTLAQGVLVTAISPDGRFIALQGGDPRGARILDLMTGNMPTLVDLYTQQSGQAPPFAGLTGAGFESVTKITGNSITGYHLGTGSTGNNPYSLLIKGLQLAPEPSTYMLSVLSVLTFIAISYRKKRDHVFRIMRATENH